MLRDPISGIVEDFTAWQEQAASDVHGCRDCLFDLLEGRSVYTERPDPTRWKAGDVRALMLSLAVPKLTGNCDLAGHGTAAMRSFLRFLDEAGRLHPDSASTTTLRRELDDVAGRYPEAMADRSRFRLAKSLYTAMRADGIDITDDGAVDAWVARFNQAPEAARRAVFGHLLGDQPELLGAEFLARSGKVAALAPGTLGDGAPDSSVLLDPADRPPDVMPTYPPVAVPSRAEVVTAARGSALMRQVVRVAQWVGQGRRAARNGSLVPADVQALAEAVDVAGPGERVRNLDEAPALATALRLASRVELIQLGRTGWSAGQRLTAWSGASVHDGRLDGIDDAEVLSLWEDLFTVVERGMAMVSGDRRVFSSERMSLLVGVCLPAIVVDLYQRAGSDSPATDLKALVSAAVSMALRWPGAAPSGEDGDVALAALSAVVCTQLDQLDAHGVIELDGPGLAVVDAAAAEVGAGGWGLTLRPLLLSSAEEVMVQLAPLGRWAVREVLVREGATAPARAAPPSVAGRSAPIASPS